MRPTFLTLTSVEHFAAFAALGGLLCIAYLRQLVFVCILVFGSAYVAELAEVVLLMPLRCTLLVTGISMRSKPTRSTALAQPRPNDSSDGALIPERLARPAESVTLQLRSDASPF